MMQILKQKETQMVMETHLEKHLPKPMGKRWGLS